MRTRLIGSNVSHGPFTKFVRTIVSISEQYPAFPRPYPYPNWAGVAARGERFAAPYIDAARIVGQPLPTAHTARLRWGISGVVFPQSAFGQSGRRKPHQTMRKVPAVQSSVFL